MTEQTKPIGAWVDNNGKVHGVEDQATSKPIGAWIDEKGEVHSVEEQTTWGDGNELKVKEKPWYVSKTIIAAGITVLSSLAGLWGINISDADQAELVSSISVIVGALGGVGAIYGRVKAYHKLTK